MIWQGETEIPEGDSPLASGTLTDNALEDSGFQETR